MSNNTISIRMIQHYLYCPHRWGLLAIDCAWGENAFVIKADLLHKRVHDPKMSYNSNDKKVFTSLSVYNDFEDYNLYGVIDCLERTETSNNIYKYCIVEYKPTKPVANNWNHDDLMQVFAQKICVDNIFNCDCKAMLYYADVKKRIELPIQENYDSFNFELKKILKEMRYYSLNGTIPEIKKGQKCNGCSMKDLCMPKHVKEYSIHALIDDMVGEKACENY